MTLTQQVFAQAVMVSEVDADAQKALLWALCQSAVSALTAQLREGITVEDCKADFVAAASLYAVAALSETDPMLRAEQMQVGDVILKRGGNSAAAACLRYQAQMLMSPYRKDSFCFHSC